MACRLPGGFAPGWTSATSGRTVKVGLCHRWCFSCLIDKNLSRMKFGFRNRSRRVFYVQGCLMKSSTNDFWTPLLTRKSHSLKKRIRG